MKKLILFAALSLTLSLNAQSFYKGALIADIRTGIEVYNTTSKLTYKTGTENRDTVQTGKAGDTHFGFGAEYGLHKYFGIGFAVNSHKFIQGKDSTGHTPMAHSTDLAIALNFHAVSTQKFDLVLGTDIGYSSFRFSVNDKANTILNGTGSYMSLYVNPRIYFGRFGINFRVFTPFFSYKNLKSNNSDFDKYWTFNNFKGNHAWGLSFGIQYRFFKNKIEVPKTKAQT